MSKIKSWISVPESRDVSEAESHEVLGLPAKTRKETKLLIGRREWLALPELGIGSISAKVDTGAYTSSLHAEDIEAFEKGGECWVRFITHDHQGHRVSCEAPIHYEKKVKSSTGKGRKRYFIRTTLRSAGGLEWTTRLSLADRSVMKCPMLLGRRALSGRFVVDPQVSHAFGNLRALTGKKPRKKGGGV